MDMAILSCMINPIGYINKISQFCEICEHGLTVLKEIQVWVIMPFKLYIWARLVRDIGYMVRLVNIHKRLNQHNRIEGLSNSVS